MSKVNDIFKNSLEKAKDLDQGKKVSVDIEPKDKDEKGEDKGEDKGEKIDESVSSSALRNVKYDPDTEMLKVQFNDSSKHYFYPDVPSELVQGLLKAVSKGEFFMANIHDQYSMYGRDHSKKNKKQRGGIRKYIRHYLKNNKGRWTK